MNGLTIAVWFVATGLLLLAAVLVKVSLAYRREEHQVDYEETEALERMRQILERETGREIAIVYRAKGYWWAQTARGSVRVDDLLRDGYVRVGAE